MYEIGKNGKEYYFKQKIESQNFVIDTINIDFNDSFRANSVSEYDFAHQNVIFKNDGKYCVVAGFLMAKLNTYESYRWDSITGRTTVYNDLNTGEEVLTSSKYLSFDGSFGDLETGMYSEIYCKNVIFIEVKTGILQWLTNHPKF